MRASFWTTEKTYGFASRLAVRTKLVMCCVLSASSIVFADVWALGFLCIASTAYALCAARPGALLKVYAVVAVMASVSLGFTYLMSLFTPLLINWDLVRFLPPFIRMFINVNALVGLVFSTPIQGVISELGRLRLPIWLSLPLSVCLRFIPTFIDDCRQIRDVARLRVRRRRSIFSRVFDVWRSLAAPVIFRVLHAADDLALAAELKGIGRRDLVPVRESAPLSRRDAVVLAAAAMAVAVAVGLQMNTNMSAGLFGAGG